MSTPNILLVTKGHPFERGPFFEIFDAIDVNWTHVEQPAARVFFNRKMAEPYDALVMYDMPGIAFGPGGATFDEPGEDYKNDLIELLESGKGMVFVHHAIAGWPAWEEYAEIIGGRFLYLADNLRGTARPDSGYRHKVEHTLTVVEDHPITRGIPANFQMTDELYLGEVFDDAITPLLTSDYAFTRDNFYSATNAINGSMFDNEGWQHDDGSNAVAWVKTSGNSPVAYLQGGDDPEAYGNQHYRQLIENAIHWVSSEDARAWAKSS